MVFLWAFNVVTCKYVCLNIKKKSLGASPAVSIKKICPPSQCQIIRLLNQGSLFKNIFKYIIFNFTNATIHMHAMHLLSKVKL